MLTFVANIGISFGKKEKRRKMQIVVENINITFYVIRQKNITNIEQSLSHK